MNEQQDTCPHCQHPAHLPGVCGERHRYISEGVKCWCAEHQAAKAAGAFEIPGVASEFCPAMNAPQPAPLTEGERAEVLKVLAPFSQAWCGKSLDDSAFEAAYSLHAKLSAPPVADPRDAEIAALRRELVKAVAHADGAEASSQIMLRRNRTLTASHAALVAEVERAIEKMAAFGMGGEAALILRAALEGARHGK